MGKENLKVVHEEKTLEKRCETHYPQKKQLNNLSGETYKMMQTMRISLDFMAKEMMKNNNNNDQQSLNMLQLFDHFTTRRTSESWKGHRELQLKWSQNSRVIHMKTE